MKMFFLVCLCLNFYSLFSQSKPVVDTSITNYSWPSLGPVFISTDGRFVSYKVNNYPANQNTLFLHDLRSGEKTQHSAKSINIISFTPDGRQLCYQQGDSIILLSTLSGKMKVLALADRVNYPTKESLRWLTISIKGSEGKLMLFDLATGKEASYFGVKNQVWSSNGNLLLLTTVGKTDSLSEDLVLINLSSGVEQVFTSISNFQLAPQSNAVAVEKTANGIQDLWWVVPNGNTQLIWRNKGSERISNYMFDNAGTQLAFITRFKKEDEQHASIWHYQKGRKWSEIRVTDSIAIKTSGFPLGNLSFFSGNGRWLYFTIRAQHDKSLLSNKDAVTPVHIWTYRDAELYHKQNTNAPLYNDFTMVVESTGGSLRRLTKPGEYVTSTARDEVFVSGTGLTGSIPPLLVPWWPHFSDGMWVESLLDTTHNRVQLHKTAQVINCSPQGRWRYYWDESKRHYVTVNLQTFHSTEITAGLPPVVHESQEQIVQNPVGIAGWFVDDEAVLVYDNFDIWKLDPSGHKTAVNLTGGYGRNNQIKLRLVEGSEQSVWNGDEELLLTGLNMESMENGFFRLRLNKPGPPELLTMGPYIYYQLQSQQGGTSTQNMHAGMAPKSGGKGKNKVWVLLRQTASEYPNYYLTKDFRTFDPLTNFQPQQAYNWLMAEGVSWTMYDGKRSHGVLYKPENFDSSKKYPVLINYYQSRYHRLHQFIHPALTGDDINIPWFVSRGYIIFTPDIHYSIAANPGGMTVCEAAINAVESGARYLAKRPYIDSTRIGIQGHSFGGLETNCLITQSNYFAAAAEVAGESDNISAYLTLISMEEYVGAIEKHPKLDKSNLRMGATPWERPDLYLRSSAVLNANRVTTPLLIAHSPIDGAVNFRQGVEMYMALRRLSKPCWFLEYPKSGHVLIGQEALDYTIRLTQYFDHYLKGNSAPRWMTMNTLASYTGKNSLYELDVRGNCSNSCKVCKEGNEKQGNTGR